jgi:hypothetical protein
MGTTVSTEAVERQGPRADAPAMRAVLVSSVVAVVSVLHSRASLHLEILALRHQLAVLQDSGWRPRLNPADRLLWVWLVWIEPRRACP